MAQARQHPQTAVTGPQRTIGCVSSLLFITLLLIVGSIILSDPTPTTQTAASSPTRPEPALAKVDMPTLAATAVQPATATATQPPTATTTNTPIPPTTTPSPTATATATNPPPTATATQPSVITITPPDAPTILPTPTGNYSWTLKVPILMYHYISIPPEDADVYRTDLSVTPANFREQMQYLADNGYTPVDLYDLSLAIQGLRDLPDRPVVLSFDDGYTDNYINAFPILQEFGFTATFFVVTEFVDFNRDNYMTWDMLKEMAAAGNRIEPHSRTHPDMRGLSREKLIWEALGPQETIAYHLGYTPRFFAYPSGRYDEDTMLILQELNYWGAVTTMGGHWHGYEDRFEWKRVRIRYATTMLDFIDVVEPDNTVGGKIVNP